MISRDRQRTVIRRTIAHSDIYKWPGLSFDGAGSLETGWVVFAGPTEADAFSLEWKYLVFMDPSSGHACDCFTVSSDGGLLAASFHADTVLVWRLSDGLLVQHLHDQGHTDDVTSVAFAPNNHHLVSGSDDTTAIIWDIRSGRALRCLEGHEDPVWTVAYSPVGLCVATSTNCIVKLWDASNGECTHSLVLGEVEKAIFFPDGFHLALELRNTGVIYNVQTGTLVATLQQEGGEHMRLAMTRQGDQILTGTHDGKAKIWDAVTGEGSVELDGQTDTITSVTFSPDGAEVAIASADCTVVTCDSQTDQRRHVWRMSSEAWSVAYSPSGNYIAMGD